MRWKKLETSGSDSPGELRRLSSDSGDSMYSSDSENELCYCSLLEDGHKKCWECNEDEECYCKYGNGWGHRPGPDCEDDFCYCPAAGGESHIQDYDCLEWEDEICRRENCSTAGGLEHEKMDECYEREEAEMMGLGDEADENADLANGENRAAIAAVLKHADRYVQLQDLEHDHYSEIIRRVGTAKQLYEETEEILHEEIKKGTQLKINMELSYILRDLASGEYSLFYAASNTALFDHMVPIRNVADVRKFMDDLHDYNFEDIINYPKSGVVPVRFAYAVWKIVRDGLPLRACIEYNKIPSFIKTNRYILTKDYRSNKGYATCQNKCVFVALAEHFVRNSIFQFGKTRAAIVNWLFDEFRRKTGRMREADFGGVKQDELHVLEKMCQIRINVYTMKEVEKCDKYPNGIKTSVMQCSTLPDQPYGLCSLLRYVDHVFYIVNLERAIAHYLCPICSMKINSQPNFSRHIQACTRTMKEPDQVREIYDSAKLYKPNEGIFQELERKLSCKFDKDIQNIKYLACFDSETLFNMFKEREKRGACTETVAKLHVFLVGACSNVDGYREPALFWLEDDDPWDMMKRFVDHLHEISLKQAELIQQQLQPVFQQIRIALIKADHSGNEYGCREIKKLEMKLQRWIECMPTMSFNGAKFDGRVCRQFLLPVLFAKYGMTNVKTMTKHSQYMSIKCPRIQFLDMINYLPVKMSYSRWIMNVLGQNLKENQCYEYITDLSKLDDPELPGYEHWNSTLKGGINVLDVDYAAYTEQLRKGVSKETALQNLGLTEEPLPGREKLVQLQRVFRERGFTKFRDWIEMYFKGDVVPFVKAAEKTYDIFQKTYGIQLFRETTTLPGAAIKVAFQYLEGVDMFVPSESSYKIFKEKIVGGPSILFSLCAMKDETKIKERQYGDDAKLVTSIFSLDSSLMYGFCMEKLPCNFERVRVPEDGFVPKYVDSRYLRNKNAERVLAFWQWYYKVTNFKTNLRGGEDQCLWSPRRYKFDGTGFLPSGQKCIWEVYGDAAHRCPIHNLDGSELHHIRKHDDGSAMTYSEVETADAKRMQNIRKCFPNADIKVFQLCEFDRDYTHVNGEYHKLYEEFLHGNPVYKLDRKKKTEREILDDIRCGRLHGFVVADFEATGELKRRTEDFPLFFQKTLVGRKDVGPLMRNYLEKVDKLRSPQVELISSHKVKQHLISTSLCAYYLELGAQVSCVSRIIEYDLTDKLNDMVQNACQLRYSASNKHEQTLGNLAKNLVVSSYGRFILNPANQRQTKYVNDEKLLKEVYGGKFSQIDYVGEFDDERYYELKSKKKVRRYRYPYHCGLWILSKSKEHILRLVYDVIEPCFKPETYAFFTTQTDSLSIICSDKSCEDWFANSVLPCMREKFAKLRLQYFVEPGDSESARRSKFKAGVFKVEWEAANAIGISAKVYAAWNDDKTELKKLSIRSVPRVAAKDSKFEDFYGVLSDHKSISVNYRLFSFVYGDMYFDDIQKTAVSACYLKREVLENLETRTLDV